ncbi:MAG: hypothetical protein AAFX06_15750 [Planctomycetota bacterium]
MMLARHRILALLTECTGDDIWSVEHCRNRSIPDAWIERLADTYESGFESLDETIFTDRGLTNQYNGVRDVDLAICLAHQLGIRVGPHDLARLGRSRLVQAIKDAVMNGDDEL